METVSREAQAIHSKNRRMADSSCFESALDSYRMLPAYDSGFASNIGLHPRQQKPITRPR